MGQSFIDMVASLVHVHTGTKELVSFKSEAANSWLNHVTRQVDLSLPLDFVRTKKKKHCRANNTQKDRPFTNSLYVYL